MTTTSTSDSTLSTRDNKVNFNGKRIALLLVDFQNEFVSEGGKFHGEVWPMMQETSMLNKIPKIMQHVRETGGVVIHSGVVKKSKEDFSEEKGCRGWDEIKHMQGLFTEGHWNSGFAIEVKPAREDIILDHRQCYDAFKGTGLTSILKKKNIDTLFIGGFLTDFCIAETVRTAAKKGFVKVFTLADGCAAKSGADHFAALSLLTKYSSIVSCSGASKLINPNIERRSKRKVLTTFKPGNMTSACWNDTEKETSTSSSPPTVSPCDLKNELKKDQNKRQPSMVLSSRRKPMTSATREIDFDPLTPVFFMLGSQRSGIQWLTERAMATQKEMWVPHSPHVLRRFMSILPTYGDLNDEENLKILVENVCTFVEQKRREPWLDESGERIIFNRQYIVDTVTDTIQILKLVQSHPKVDKKKNRRLQRQQSPPSKFDNRLYLIGIFDEIMNIGAARNHKHTWMSTATEDGQYHDLLISYYGKERLRFLYSVRDPRDIVISHKMHPSVDKHSYFVSAKWAHVQQNALDILSLYDEIVLAVKYESFLYKNEETLKRIDRFVGRKCFEPDFHKKKMRNKEKMILDVVESTGNKENTIQTWHEALLHEDMHIIEIVCLKQMSSLGYTPFIINDSSKMIQFTREDLDHFEELNKGPRFYSSDTTTSSLSF